MRSAASWLGAILASVSAFGCNDAQPPSAPSFTEAGTSGTSVAEASNPDVDGFWATYANEMDGTVVSLHANGNAITGRGCLSGWVAPTAAPASDQCGEITGTLVGNQVSFEFYFGPGPGPWDTYAVNVQLLASGSRMNGEQFYYHTGSPTPLPGATKTAAWEGPVTVFRSPMPGAYGSWPFAKGPLAPGTPAWVRLLGDAPAGRYAPGTLYELRSEFGGLQGDLGVFAPVDLAYEYAETGVTVIHAEQMAQLDPDAPVSLELEVRDARVENMHAKLPTGEMLSFAP